MRALLLGLIFAAAVWGQVPDCQYIYHFTNRTGDLGTPNQQVLSFGSGPSIKNILSGCTSWTLSYNAEGISGISIELDDAPNSYSSGATPGTFVTFAGTTVIGTNPMTSTNAAVYTAYGYYPWIRVNITSYTGAGSVDVVLNGWKSITLAGINALPPGTTATTQTPLTNNTTVATTAYTDAAVAAGGGGISPVYDTATSGQTGNLGAVTMVTPGANHNYLFTWTIELSVAGTSCTGSTSITLNAIFQSINGGSPTTEVLGTITLANNGVGTVGFIAEHADNIIAKSGTAVQFSTTGYTLGAGCTGTNPTYIVYPSLVQI